VLEGLGAVVYSYAKFALVRPLPLFFAGNLQVQGWSRADETLYFRRMAANR